MKTATTLWQVPDNSPRRMGRELFTDPIIRRLTRPTFDLARITREAMRLWKNNNVLLEQLLAPRPGMTREMFQNSMIRKLQNHNCAPDNDCASYDDEFARPGAKIGTTLRIRLPYKTTSANL